MRVPVSWLKEYVNLTLTPDELAYRLTMSGLEVEKIEHTGADWERDKLVVGEIVETKPHPNADRLTIALVNDGSSAEPKLCITGAPNIKPGMQHVKVPFARLGATIVDGHTDDGSTFVIKPAKLRGIASEGVLCSEKELGISADHSGIMLLDPRAPVGMPLVDWLGDTVLEIAILPNIARALSVTGVAREVAALTGEKLRYPQLTGEGTGPAIAGQIHVDKIHVEIADPDLCARYSAAIIRHVTIGPSPLWMQRRLTLAGMRPINNIVDITNYVMLELGQPLHAFDYDRLPLEQGRKQIVVRRARPGEQMRTLDGQLRTFTPDMLLITAGETPVAIGGIMGGEDTEVHGGTRTILLEAANFDFINNRRAAQLLRLPSEAAGRFGRGVDPELTIPALQRAGEFMRLYAGGAVDQGFADAYPGRKPPLTIPLTAREVQRLLGMDLSQAEIAALLRSLDFQVAEQGEVLLVTVPSFRLDVTIAADLVEEVGRVIGSDRLPATQLADELPPPHRDLLWEHEQAVKEILVGCGLQEIITYSMTTPEAEAKVYLDTPEAAGHSPAYIRLANPISSERTAMRRTLLNSMMENLALNLRYRQRITIFEVARVYLPEGGSGDGLPAEPARLGIALTGPRIPHDWSQGTAEAPPLDFFDLKGIVETLLTDRLHIQGVAFRSASHPSMHPGRCAELLIQDQVAGVLGEVHPLVAERYDIPGRVCLAEIRLDQVLPQVQTMHLYHTISRFPAVTQDIAVIVDDETAAAAVEQVIRETGSSLLRHVQLFDIYRGEQIPSGKKSLAYTLEFQADDRTLTEDEVATLRHQIVQTLAERLGASLRA
ncbi:MAG: phenylalanine--tRNA ligase subunit beta [Chloroflexi bacterium]|nr:phenylalanine--tRNA ligase subunit beta [Chloroflexota bacterium]